MKNTPRLLVLAAVLCAAAPVFADRTPIEFLVNDRDSSSMLGPITKKDLRERQSPQTFNVSSLEQDSGRIGATFDARINVLSEDDKSSELGALLTSGTHANFHSVKLDFEHNNGNSFGENNNGKAWGKHHGKSDGGGNDALVSVSEPSPESLLLFGLAGLGLLFCRRNILRTAV